VAARAVNNAERILAALDDKLHRKVELTLYGRAALSLGFEDAPEEFGQSQDIDGVLWIGQADDLAATTNFWEAVEELNEQFKDQELYISHLFQEDQLILSPDWKSNRQKIDGPWKKLTLYRLGDADLFLTKLMRHDATDIADAKFIVRRTGWSNDDLTAIISQARFPDAAEVREQFAIAAAHFLMWRRRSKERVALDSSAIAAVTYDRERHTLDVEFRNGNPYRYFNVPLSVYRDLLKAESAGAFWKEIKNDYTYVKLN
jgi:KTSC domain-containing protein